MDELKEFARKIRIRALEMAYLCGENVHLGGALSIVDILAVLYGKVLKHLALDKAYEMRDKFILSKGHGALALFATLGEIGIIPQERLNTYLYNGSSLCAHPIMEPEIGIESSNGSLGQGISMAAGLALAAKKKKYNYQVYTIVGNGECDEGIVWEALAFAVHFKLDNLTIILDDNKFQNDGPSEAVMAYPNYRERFLACGFQTLEINGNRITEIVEAFEADRVEGKPKMIVANTVKGKGISFMEGDNSWHHGRLTEEQYRRAMNELKGQEYAD